MISHRDADEAPVHAQDRARHRRARTTALVGCDQFTFEWTTTSVSEQRTLDPSSGKPWRHRVVDVTDTHEAVLHHPRPRRASRRSATGREARAGSPARPATRPRLSRRRADADARTRPWPPSRRVGPAGLRSK